VEEATDTEMLIVSALASRVSELKGLGLTRVSMAANWLAHRVTPLKKQVHPGWEYSGVQDPTRESKNNIEANKLVELLQEMFQNINSWLTPEHVRTYHLHVERDPERQCRFYLFNLISITHTLHALLQALDNLIVHIPGFGNESMIQVVPISARALSADSAGTSTGEDSVEPPLTRASKHKAAAMPTPSRKARKAVGKRAIGIKINEPTPKTPSAQTPPSHTRGRFMMR
jgi:hypothetical protein